jgi:hypothetical protein
MPGTVPDTHTHLPGIPATSSAHQETSPTIVNITKACSRAKLLHKNRKQNQVVIEFPGAVIAMERGTNYSFSGFTPDMDAGVWTLHEAQIRISGKGGATTTCHFNRIPEGI